MRAAVVGCGLGGMAAALALSRRGVDVTLFEAFQTPAPIGSGLLLQPSGLCALATLGLEDEIRAAGARVERLIGRDIAGRRVMDMGYAHWRPGAHGVGIHRAVLFQTLYDALAKTGVAIRTGVRIDRIEAIAAPLLIDDAGAAHGPFDVAVIADGSASHLRTLVRPKAKAPLYPWGAVWANCADPDGAFDGALRQVYQRAEVMIGVLPVGRGPAPGETRMVSLFWSMPRAELADFHDSDFGIWKARVEALWPATAPLLASLTSHAGLSPAVYRDVIVGRWCNGGAVLIGDAAHATSPQLGQGANLALVDAVELADALTAGRGSIHRTLIGYQAQRRRHTGLYQLASRALTPLFQSHGWFWHRLRDLLFTPLSQAPGLRRLAAIVLVGVARIGPAPTRVTDRP